MLDIIITHYKEPWEICRRQFLMLDMQRRVDWNEIHVTVVNDGGFRLPEFKLADLSFPVEQVDIPHGGISAARNAGIEHATEPWIMFCDCDDCFSNIYALDDVLNVLRGPAAQKYDLMWTKCYDECAESIMLVPQSKTFVFCHGKVYRRQFLMDEEIRFREELRMNEDSCFNATVIARTQRVAEIRSHVPVYSWLRRPGSVTTRPEAVDDGAYCQTLRNMIVTEENRAHRPDQYPSMVTRTVYDAYYMIHGKRISESCKQKILEVISLWIMPRFDVFGRVPKEILDGIRAISRSELLEPGEDVPDEKETVGRWARRIAGQEG